MANEGPAQIRVKTHAKEQRSDDVTSASLSFRGLQEVIVTAAVK